MSQISPRSGPTLGGSRLTIHGRRFGNGSPPALRASADSNATVRVGTAHCAIVARNHTTCVSTYSLLPHTHTPLLCLCVSHHHPSLRPSHGGAQWCHLANTMDNLLAAGVKQLNHHKVMQTPANIHSKKAQNTKTIIQKCII